MKWDFLNGACFAFVIVFAVGAFSLTLHKLADQGDKGSCSNSVSGLT